ncbi:MAG: BrnT family toxin [Anaerolineae bacterium]|nr:MAG: BrnT family toxin [Anaerolineae bacterium]
MADLPHLPSLTGFDWDEGNLTKNWEKHRVRAAECEEVFFNEPLMLFPDVGHSQVEPRYYVLGHTNAGRRLFVVFTIRGDKIRVISARDMSRKERKVYEQAQETDS